MAQTVEIFAYTGSDTKEYLKATTKTPEGSPVPIDWRDYDAITLTLRNEVVGSAGSTSIGAHVATVSSVTSPDLFEVVGQSGEVLVINTSKVPGIAAFTRYESLLKVHDAAHPDGMVIADYKQNNSLPTLLLRVYPGEDE